VISDGHVDSVTGNFLTNCSDRLYLSVKCTFTSIKIIIAEFKICITLNYLHIVIVGLYFASSMDGFSWCFLMMVQTLQWTNP
jgi:hypothetical protein